MKKIILPFLILLQLTATAQQHSLTGKARRDSLLHTVSADSLIKNQRQADPDSTGVGDPIGDKTVQSIGPAGGRIRSADGRLELIFPEDALTAPTDISIQAVVNKTGGGLGNAYACGPDGIRFRKPVQLLIHYSDSVCKSVSPSFHHIRWQDNNGRWNRTDRTEVDSTARTVTASINHFSTYADATDFWVGYEMPPVKVARFRTYNLFITGTWPDGKQHPSSDLDGRDKFWREHTVNWYVDGILNGDDKVGTIVLGDMLPTSNYCIYFAPMTLPDHNPEITAEYVGFWEPRPGVTVNKAKTKCDVHIFDEFHYSFTGFDKVGHLHMVDSTTCDIRLESSGKVTLKNLKNPTPWCDWPPTFPRDKCSYVYPDKTNWKGMVEIAGMTTGKIYLPSENDPSTSVLIQLTPTMGNSPRYTETCKGKKRLIPSLPVFAQPTYIQFESRYTGDILITYKGATGINFIDDMRGEQGFAISVSHSDN